MNIEEMNKKTVISTIKDTLKHREFIWSDTKKLISYDELLNVLEMEEPLSDEEAKQVYSSLSNDPRIVKKKDDGNGNGYGNG